ncbi:frizzled-4 [Toxorhynchites rutilus septentrionalis]|uniref:frizzled-4 n=1 Tax=Toxorhynchites rutilus septentrionalis TaxID=329112 RepID=UPI00247A3191|nr:frizzled-4 [Toxorhynchites rutilus septentrionalis]
MHNHITVKMLGMILLLLIGCTSAVLSTSDFTAQRTCEPIRIELCRGIGYNETSLPNLVGHELQSDADFTLQTFSPLIQYGCSKQLKFFLCAAYVPMCTPKVPMPIGPCRGLCLTVKTLCHPILQGFGFPWPSALDCSRFPEENNHEHMCMQGPGEPTDSVVMISNNDRPTCQGLIKSHLYVRLNRSGRCAPLCEADIMFEQNEKHFAEVWLTSWSVAALFTAIVATLCLILATKRWDKILMPLVISHCLVTVGWAVRWLAGRNATACGYDIQLPGVSLLLTDGLMTAPCAATFLLRYYFGMTAAVWWAILCLRWSKSVRRLLNTELSGDHHSEKSDSSYSTLFQLAAWGLPAVQTVVVLVVRLVDADELFGSCFIGNQSDKALLGFVIVPLLTYWVIGSGYLFTAYLRKRSASALLVSNLPVHINGMGKFLFIYSVPSSLLLVVMFYEFAYRENWLSTPHPSLETVSSAKAPIWPFIARAVVELLVGVLASAWAVGPRIAGLCRSKVNNQVYKQPAPKFGASPFSAASYQTVCPQNSLVSVSIGKVPPRHARKYPSHSHINRKPRNYKASSQTMSLTGNETVL